MTHSIGSTGRPFLLCHPHVSSNRVCSCACSLKSQVLRDLSALKISPKRSLGQNFVISDEVLQRIVRTASIEKGDRVLEIGPGLGSLTQHLLDAGAHVLAVEKDDTLYRHLQQKFLEESAVTLIHADILSLSNMPLLMSSFQPEPTKRLKVVANIPYSLTTSVLKSILPLQDYISCVLLLLEEGAAKRLTQAQPGDKDYRAMSVLINLWSRPKFCFHVSREAFFPAPSVDSGVAEFVLKSPPEPMHRLDEEEFLAFVAISFQSKRKTLTNNLKVAYRPDFVQSCLKSIGLPKAVRAESLDVKLFLELFHCISKRD